MDHPTIPCFYLPHGQGLPVPAYQTESASGLDLYAALDGPRLSLPPGGYDAIPTGLCVAIPEGYEGQIRPRSGLALKYGIGMVNSLGTIDADYRGELKALLINHGARPFVIERGERIAQLVIAPVARARLAPTATWPPSETGRGTGAFGSTGTKG